MAELEKLVGGSGAEPYLGNGLGSSNLIASPNDTATFSQATQMTRRKFVTLAVPGAISLAAAMFAPGIAEAGDGKRRPIIYPHQIGILQSPEQSIEDKAHGTGNAADEKIVLDILSFLKDRYVHGNRDYMSEAAKKLYASGIQMENIVTVTGLNKHLIPRGYYLTYAEATSPFRQLVKVYKIGSMDNFGEFTDDSGKKRNDIFGFRFGPYKRYLLGEEVFTSNKRSTWVGVNKKVDGIGWTIGIPYLAMARDLGRSGQEVFERMIEAASMHEAAHITFRTPFESFAYIVQLGYRLDEGVRIMGPEDIASYLETRTLTFSKTSRYHLDEIYLRESGGFKPSDQGRASLGKDIKAITEKVHAINPKYPKDPMKISDQQLNATMGLLFNRFESVHKQYPPKL